MSHRRMLSRLALGVVLAGLLTAPAASATPFEQQATVTQDARGEAAAGARTAERSATTTRDARGEAAAGGGSATAEPAGPFNRLGLPGPPMWPENPTTLAPRAAPATPDGGDGVDLPVVLLIVAGTLALGGGMALVALKARTGTQPAH